MRPPVPTLPQLTSHTSRWYTLLALPDQNRLARRDLHGFRTDRHGQNLSPSQYASRATPVTRAANNLRQSLRARDDALPCDTPQDHAASRAPSLASGPGLRRSLGPGARSSTRPVRPVPSASVSETLQARMASNAMAAAARAKRLQTRSERL
jgi:hypothetical protein